MFFLWLCSGKEKDKGSEESNEVDETTEKSEVKLIHVVISVRNGFLVILGPLLVKMTMKKLEIMSSIINCGEQKNV